MSRLAAVGALSHATRLELIRRPGGLLALAAVGALTLLAQRLSGVALDRDGALALELSLSTAALFCAVFGGIAGVRAVSRGGDIGPAPELLAGPLDALTYVLGRYLGILTAVALLLAGLVLIGGAGIALGSGRVENLGAVLAAIAGGYAQGALLGAVGMALGSISRPQLAMVLVLAYLAASRLLLPQLSDGGGVASWLAAACPDPGRLDWAREAAFGRPVGGASGALAAIAAGGQVSALLLVSAAGLRPRD